jgi:hypothetical protein
VLWRDHRVGHDAQPYCVAIIHQRQGQTWKHSQLLYALYLLFDRVIS